MFRDPLTLLAYEARKKPAIAALVTSIGTLSEDDIRTADLPMAWMRDALLTLRRKHIAERDRPLIEAWLDQHSSSTLKESPQGEVRRWAGPDQWFGFGRSSMLFATGDLVWFPITGGVWCDSLFSPWIDQKLHSATEPVRVCDRATYRTLVYDRRAGHTTIPHTMDVSPVEGSPAVSPNQTGFRIIRPPKGPYDW